MRFLVPLLLLAITVYGIVDCAQADERTRRNVPLWVWVLVMVALPGLGAIIWLVLSRLIEPTATPPRSRPVAPDDDPDFLRYLDRRTKPGEAGKPGDQPTDQPVQDEPES